LCMRLFDAADQYSVEHLSVRFDHGVMRPLRPLDPCTIGQHIPPIQFCPDGQELKQGRPVDGTPPGHVCR
uniref:Penicillin-binding protein n=1 Tax=Anisakis simplex TaxID=6269 RepID=A0A0M3JM66_ANISI